MDLVVGSETDIEEDGSYISMVIFDTRFNLHRDLLMIEQNY